MSVYRPEGSKVYLCDFSFKGSRIRESTHQTSKTLAREYETKRKRELQTGLAGLRKRDIPAFFAEAAERWYEQKAGSDKWGESMTKIARGALDRHLLPALGKRLIIDMTAGTMNRYIQDRSAEGAAAGTIAIEQRCIRAILRSYGLWERIRQEPHAPRISEGEPIGRALTFEEETLLLGECARSRSRFLFAIRHARLAKRHEVQHNSLAHMGQC